MRKLRRALAIVLCLAAATAVVLTLTSSPSHIEDRVTRFSDPTTTRPATTPEWPDVPTTTSSTTTTVSPPAPTTTTTAPAPPQPAPQPVPAVTQAPPPPTTPGDCGGHEGNPDDGTGVTCAEYLAWSQVAVCEEGGWVGASGSAYPDSLGINATNWWGNGGTDDTSPDAQIVVAERIQTDPPDQGGCNGSW